MPCEKGAKGFNAHSVPTSYTSGKDSFCKHLGKRRKYCFARAGLNHFIKHLQYNNLTMQYGLFMTLRKKPFENIVGKEENACNQHFLHFPKCYLLYQRPKLSF